MASWVVGAVPDEPVAVTRSLDGFRASRVSRQLVLLGVLVALTVAARSQVASHDAPAATTGPRTILGLKPAVADMLWMSVLRGAGRVRDYDVGSESGSGRERTARLTARMITAIRLAPDEAATRGWDGVLILGLLGDTIGAGRVVEEMRLARPGDPWAPLAEAAWLKWGIEGDTGAALGILVRAQEEGRLDAVGRRFARGLAEAAGETTLLERWRVE